MQKVGILGGGQLGRMLLQAAVNYPVETYLMENDTECPAAHLCHHFVKGDIKNFNDVYEFAKCLDAVTIEIEAVNEDALEQLEKEGVKIYPKPSVLRIIKNKILQKQFYKYNEIPTADFKITQNLKELNSQENFLPAIHKIALGGYDGRGVIVINNKEEIRTGFDGPAILENKIDVKEELALIIAVSNQNETAIYPAVNMVFNSDLNLLDYQFSPPDLPEKIILNAVAIAVRVVNGFASPGIFAVEMFVDQDDNVWVNETAPRVHNSGHHTIEANYSSQFDMLWRVMLDYPLGNTKHIMPAAIVNILGAPNYSGIARYAGLNEVLKIENVFVHIYGKKQTKPGRKMGHVTILSKDKKELIQKAITIKSMLKVIT